MVRSLIVTTQKNEGAFLLEWLAHHKSIGFDDILVLSNDCSDGNDTMLDRLQDMGELTHVRNDGPYDDRGIQFTALKIAETHPLVQSADWIVSMDIDEFVNIHVGTSRKPRLFAVSVTDDNCTESPRSDAESLHLYVTKVSKCTAF